LRVLALVLLVVAGAARAQIYAPIIAVGEPPPTVGPEMMVTEPYLRSVGPFMCGPLHLTPNLAWNGRFLAVWIEEVTRPSVFASRLLRDGSTPDGRGIRVSETELFQRNVVVASDGQDFLLVWMEETLDARPAGFLRARRLSREGVLMGPVLTLSQSAALDSRPAVGWDGLNYLVVWESMPNSNKELVASRVSSSGFILDAIPIRIDSQDDTNPSNPSLTWTGSVYMVVWTQSDRAAECTRLPCPFITRHIHGARVTSGGVVLDRPSLQISQSTVIQASPDVAWNGQTFLVIWSRDENNTRRGIWAKRIDASGSIFEEPSEPVGIQVVPNVGSDLLVGRVESDGTGFLVAWVVNDSDLSIWGSRVSREGFLLDSASPTGGFPLANSELDEDKHEIIKVSDGRFGLVYRRETVEGGCPSARTVVRLIGEALPPEPPPPPPPPPPPAPTRRRPVRQGAS